MSSAERVLRYEVPVDDEWHRLTIEGRVVHVGCRRADVVEFWTTPREYTMDGPVVNSSEAEFRVFGTGHALAGGSYVGTTYAPGGALVWHLFARKIRSRGTAT